MRHLRRAGVRTSDVSCSISPKRYYSAYFGVPGLGEVRVSDHPAARELFTSNMSLDRPKTYLDLARAFVARHNSATGGNLAVIEREPYILDACAAAILEETLEARRLEAADALARLTAEESARREWWNARIAESGLPGDPKDIKAKLKKGGVRYPSPSKE